MDSPILELALALCFRCVACDQAADSARAFPLCSFCLGSLASCPPLCPACGSPACLSASESACRSPWSHEPGTEPPLSSFSARYLLLTPAYRVLLRWKTRRGPLLDRRILRWDPDLRQRLLAKLQEGLEETLRPTGAAWIVPVPQNPARSWKLRGSPAEAVAESLARSLGLPLLRALEFREFPEFQPGDGSGSKRQAELGVRDRFANPLPIDLARNAAAQREIPGASLLLVDDFMTSGRTLALGARLLKSAGAAQVHAFCLGVRPRAGGDDSQDNGVSPSSRPRLESNHDIGASSS